MCLLRTWRWLPRVKLAGKYNKCLNFILTLFCFIYRIHLVLVEGNGKFENQLQGKTDTYKRVILNSRNAVVPTLSAE